MEMVREHWDSRQVASVAFGLIVFEEDSVSAPFLQNLFGLTTDVHVARIPFAGIEDGPDEFGAKVREAAASILRSAPPRVIGLACTTKAIELGDERLRNAMPGGATPVDYLTPVHAASAALALLGAHRVSLISPYSSTQSQRVDMYLEAAGFSVPRIGYFDAENGLISSIAQDSIFNAARRCHAEAPADAMFLSCTGMRSTPLIEAIEAELGVPVLTSLQLMGWRAAQLLGISVSGPGRLFSAKADISSRAASAAVQSGKQA